MFEFDFVSALIGGIIGATFTLFTKFGAGFIDAYHKKREKKTEFKDKMAQEVLAFCTEASSSGYNAMPKDQIHIKFIATNIESIDKEVAENLRQYLGKWTLCALPQDPSSKWSFPYPSKKDLEYAKALQASAQRLEKILLDKVKKW